MTHQAKGFAAVCALALFNIVLLVLVQTTVNIFFCGFTVGIAATNGLYLLAQKQNHRQSKTTH